MPLTITLVCATGAHSSLWVFEMVLEPCLAELPHCGHINFGVACISKLLDAHLIDASKHTKLCQAVRLLLSADACCCAAWIKHKDHIVTWHMTCACIRAGTQVCMMIGYRCVGGGLFHLLGNGTYSAH